MLFKVEMTVIPPAHLSEEEFNAIKLKEKKLCRRTAGRGNLGAPLASGWSIRQCEHIRGEG